MQRILVICLLLVLLHPIHAQDNYLPELEPVQADNFANLRELASWGRGGPRSFKWTPDGNHFVVANGVGLWIYDPNAPLAEPRLIIGDNSPNEALAFASPTIAVTLEGVSANQNVRVWNLETGENHRIIQGRNDIPSSFAIQPNGVLVAVPTRQPAVELWNLETGEQVAVLEGFETMPYGIAFNPDGTILAVDEGGQRIHLWDTSTYEQIGILTGHNGGIVLNLMFTTDGSEVVAVAGEVFDETQTIHIWNLASQEEQLVFPVLPATIEADISSRGDIALKGRRGKDYFVQVYSLSTGELRFELALGSPLVEPLGFSPDGSTLLVSSNGGLRAWDVVSSQEVPTFSHRATLAAAVSPDSEYLAIAWANDVVELISLEDGQVEQTWTIVGIEGGRFQFNLDNSQLLFEQRNGTVFIWDTRNGSERFVYRQDSHPEWLRVSKDFRYIGLIKSGSVSVLTIPDLDPVFNITGDFIYIEFSLDNNFLLSIDVTQQPILWQVQTGQQFRQFTPSLSEYVSASLDNANERLAIISSEASGTGDDFALNTVFEVWDLTSGNVISELELDGQWYTIDFHSEANLIVSSGMDENFYEAILIWDLDTNTTTIFSEGITGGGIPTINNQGDIIAYGSGTSPLVWIADRTNPDNTMSIWTGGGAYGQQFSDDDNLLLTVASSGLVRLWGVPRD